MSQSASKQRLSPSSVEGVLPKDFATGVLALDDPRLERAAIELAKALQKRASELQTPQERRQQAELDRMLEHPEDKATLTQITDQSFRSNSPGRVVDQMVHILDVQGVPRFFSVIDQALLKGFQSFGEYLPGVAVPLVKEKMRKETANVILPAEEDKLRGHLMERTLEGVRMNVNFLGEAILGEQECRKRLDRYLSALQMPEIECVSIKISTLYSQISALAREHTIRVVSDRLELLYRAAAKERFVRLDKTQVPKFVYLDMEEYRDLSLTAVIFMRTLDRPGMEQVRAGIALQAYVPDSALVQQSITQWARKRVEQGKSPVTIRIVKGANMEMERVEASLRGWPQAPYRNKIQTDANYKRMLRYAMEPEHLQAIQLGIASHNLFDLAYAMVLAVATKSLDRVQFEMLEGMANHQRRAVLELSERLLLYAPACYREEFINAIGYLIRRLDENTGPDNFLRHAFKIQVDSSAWQRLENGFVESIRRIDQVPMDSRRTQDRNVPVKQPATPSNWRRFSNEPDTDFSLDANTAWAEKIVRDWMPRCDLNAPQIPISIGNGLQQGKGKSIESIDPSRPGVVAARYTQADEIQLQMSLECLKNDPSGWGSMAPQSRYGILRQVAQELRNARADLIGSAILDAGKTILESDPEVSEAVDFVEFYARCALDLQIERGKKVAPAGPVVVISPWNFPIAIPCGGIAAALASGNTVLLKPASDTVLPAYVLCECFWKAGVPREALQFVPASGPLVSKILLSDDSIARVILTGGTQTALNIMETNPRVPLLAETGGKNATILSGLCDRDLAIKNLLHSAFSHGGQKCSATSLALLDREIFQSQEFKDQFADAVMSLRVGSAWDLSTKIGPLIRPPSGDLLRGLKELERSEKWLVMPSQVGDNPCMFTPGVKWNVQAGSFTHHTELFGPVLGVMEYSRLEQAIEMVNATGYGLTSGLESLDDREQEIWKTRIRAGNLYLNRPTTGAIVLRQPFGGLGKSAFGPGTKAGGPNYVTMLHRWDTQIEVPSLDSAVKLQHPMLQRFWDRFDSIVKGLLSLDESFGGDLVRLRQAIVQYDRYARDEILQQHDHFRLVGQDNYRRYLAINPVHLRVEPSDSVWGVLARCAAAVTTGGGAVVSYSPWIDDSKIEAFEKATLGWAGKIEWVEQSEEELCEELQQGRIRRLRYDGRSKVSQRLRALAPKHYVYIADCPVSFEDLELLWYVVEQSISLDYHRYGNLGPRSEEPRSPVL
jgi:RHH-type proline utilization regulon transcriptional repressor/proline dehydrogenase/delta 1-pyrroline-5-carboxylate dehydrogenase